MRLSRKSANLDERHTEKENKKKKREKHRFNICIPMSVCILRPIRI